MRVPLMVAALLAAGAVAPAPAIAGVIHVPSVQSTIQAGIDAAVPGDTVLVAPGTYSGPDNRELTFGGKDLVLRSSGGAAVTSIDCQSQGRGVVFQNGETAASVVEGFTIENGFADGTFGGAILVEGGATPAIRWCGFVSNRANTGGAVYVEGSGVTLTGCDFDRNAADNYGGAVYGFAADMELDGCSFTENQAGIGAGVYVHSGSTTAVVDCSFTENVPLNIAGGVYGSGSTLTFERCDFVGHTGKNGAGVYLLNGTASADSCTFRLNTADYGGGGMYAWQVEAFIVTWCTFESNETLMGGVADRHPGGGGLRFGASEPPVQGPHIADCTFIANRARGESGGSGGGMRVQQCWLVERCRFVDNHADRNGGGASCGGELRECVFERNSAGGTGGGQDGADDAIDCVFIDNHAGQLGGGANAVDVVVRCEFSGNSADLRGGGLSWTFFPPYAIEDSRFSNNHSPEGGGIYVFSVEPSLVMGCTFEHNTGFHDGGAAIIRGPTEDPAPVTFSGCTLVGNGSPLGAGGLNLWIPVEIENTIIAFGTEGEAIRCTDIGVGVISCTDIYGNAGGDWTGCISDQLGINGNFSADPLFCNVAAGDYTLAETSPCAPGHSPAGCGLIGALPVACVNPIGVAVEAAPPVAGRLRVAPNPMRGGGIIEWVNNAPGAVNLRLYDPLGRLVTSRSLGLVPEGRQELRWDGLAGDRRLPPGVYLLELGGPAGGMDRSRVVLIR